tara:strand:+ start:1025 stop:1660 length:636 start_codon:yes stop_codon:yes gene_type:complete
MSDKRNITQETEHLQNHWSRTKEYSSAGYESSPYVAGRELLAQKIVDTKPKSILEIGVFGGANLDIIHKLDSSIELTGFDINEKALVYAKEKIPNLNTINGSIYNLSEYFTENSFDVVLTAGVLIHIPCWDISESKIDRKYIDDITKNIFKIASNFVFHAEHHDNDFSKLEGKGMRYIHNFNELYSDAKNVEIEDAPNRSNGFEQIIKVTL